MEVSVNYLGPIPAPIVHGQKVATLRIDAANMAAIERPLLAGANVARKGLFGRLNATLKHLLFGDGSN